MSEKEPDEPVAATLRQSERWALRTVGILIIAAGSWWTGFVWSELRRIPSPERQARVTQHLDIAVPFMQATLVRLTTIQERDYAEIMRRLERIERQTSK